MCCVIFFFFQAEDGIRDYKVTGVQTCALPIYRESRRLEREERHELLRRLRVAPRVRDGRLVPVMPVGDDGLARRSEERRVGKSVDLGGRRIIKKKTRETE